MLGNSGDGHGRGGEGSRVGERTATLHDLTTFSARGVAHAPRRCLVSNITKKAHFLFLKM